MKIKKTKIYKWLLFMTNNEKVSKFEIEFDIFGFVVGGITLFVGIAILLIKNSPEWIAFLVLESIWAYDGLRAKNRE